MSAATGDDASPALDALPVRGERRVAVRVTDDALRWIRSGHPWVFEDSITSDVEGGAPGDLAIVFDRKRRFAAIGLLDPTSAIRVRIIHHGEQTTIDDAWWDRRVREAVTRRSGLLASEATTGIRCISGENDGLPGLVVDLYGGVAVVKIYSPAWFPHLRTIVPAVADATGAATVVLRLARSTAEHAPPGIGDGSVLLGAAPEGPVPFRENGLALEADVIAGQKTGYFLDQRDNRRLVGAASEGARVLDVFCAGGGFTVAAAAGGAASVLSIDIAGPALEATKRNLDLNRDLEAVRRCRHEARRGDAFEVMADLAERGETFDVVVVDPPSFARRGSEVAGAIRAYERLTALAVALVRDGGLLVQASCSSRVAAADFFDAVHRSARRSGVALEDVRTTGHPSDHPIGFPEGAYLKALYARVERRPALRDGKGRTPGRGGHPRSR